jgi:hypothetical protein
MRIRGPVAQWTTRLTTNQKIAGSSPARIGNFLHVTKGDLEENEMGTHLACIRGPVAQWTTRLTTNQKIAGSSPARIVGFFVCKRSNIVLSVQELGTWLDGDDEQFSRKGLSMN